MKFKPTKPCILDLDLDLLAAALQKNDFPAFRAKQILDWIYKKRVQSWDEMLNLPKELRSWLDSHYTLMPHSLLLQKGDKDTTQKFLLKLEDNSLIETVLIQAPQEKEDESFGRKTICISTQVGCAYGCKFCASGLAGWKRDLSTGEIVSQLLRICWILDPPIHKKESAPFDNIVVMGMGEPLANYDNLVKAICILNAKWGLNFGARRITVSTSGLAPQIMKLAQEPIQFRLAISLHGATNEVRNKIMPINKRYPLEELLPAAQYFAKKHKRMITLEFILIEEINDSLEQAQALGKIAKDLHAHINLIPYNKVDGLPWKRPSIKRQQAFMKALKVYDISATIRREKGHSIDAACGQLRLQHEKPKNI